MLQYTDSSRSYQLGCCFLFSQTSLSLPTSVLHHEESNCHHLDSQIPIQFFFCANAQDFSVFQTETSLYTHLVSLKIIMRAVLYFNLILSSLEPYVVDLFVHLLLWFMRIVMIQVIRHFLFYIHILGKAS